MTKAQEMDLLRKIVADLPPESYLRMYLGHPDIMSEVEYCMKNDLALPDWAGMRQRRAESEKDLKELAAQIQGRYDEQARLQREIERLRLQLDGLRESASDYARRVLDAVRK